MALLPDPTTAKSRRRGSGRKKLEKARMRGGVQGGSRGSRAVWGGPGVPGGSRGGPELFGGKRLEHEKTRKTLRNCVASLLRSNIQDFVQEVPVGQMAQGTPFSVPAMAHPPRRGEKGEVKPPKCPTRQSWSADIYVSINLSICPTTLSVYLSMYRSIYLPV